MFRNARGLKAVITSGLLALCGLVQAASLSGIVSNQVTGDPVSGVNISVANRPMDSLMVVTDTNGMYSFEDLDHGPSTLFAFHPEFEPHVNFQLILEEGMNTYDFAMTPSGNGEVATLQGYAYNEDGEGIAGVQILDPVGPTDEVILTDDTGFYSYAVFEGVSPFLAVHPDYQEFFQPHFEVEAGSNSFDFVMSIISDTHEPASLAGIVTTGPAGEPLEGVQIIVNSGPFYSGEAFSNAGGEFFLDSLAAGNAMLHAVKQGYQPLFMDLQLDAGQNFIDLQMQMRDHNDVASLDGTIVSHESGQPIPQAQVFLFEDFGVPLHTFSDMNGHFHFDHLSEGQHLLNVEATGFAPFSEDVLLSEGENSVDVELFLDDTGGDALLNGFVFDLENNSALAGVEVLLSNNWGMAYSAVSNDEGQFELVAPSGGYLLHGNKPGYQEFVTQVFLGEGPNAIEFGMLHEGQDVLASLSGVVTDMFTGAPLAEVEIHLPGMRPMDPPVLTDEDGYYEADHLFAGPAFIFAFKPGYFEFEQDLFLEEGSNTLDFAMQAHDGNGFSANLSGTVSDAATGEGISGVSIFVSGMNGVSVELLSGENGHYDGTGLATGLIDIFATIPAYHNYFDNLILQSGDNAHDFVMVARDGHSGDVVVDGHIYDTISRLPIAGATVQLTSMDGTMQQTSADESGAFSFEAIASDHAFVQLFVEAEGYLPEMQDVFLGHHGTRTVDVFMTPQDGGMLMGVLSGTVSIEGTDIPYPAMIEAIEPNVGFPLGYTTMTNPNGSWSLDVPEGEYVVLCRVMREDSTDQMDYIEFYDNVHSLEEATVLDVAMGTVTSDIDFEIPPMDGRMIEVQLSGRVTDDSGLGLADVIIRFWTPEGELEDTFTETDEDGFWDATIILDRLPIVPFTVSAEHNLYNMEFFSDAPSFNTATQFSFGADGAITNMDFGLSASSADLSNLGGQMQDVNGTPIGSGLVAAFNRDGSFVSTVSATADGEFLLQGLDTENVVLMYYAPGYAPVFSGGAHEMDNALELNTSLDNLDLDMQLQTVNQSTGQHVLLGQIADESGNGLGGALVLAVSSSGELVHYTFSNAQGSYQLDGLTGPETYTVYYSLAGFHSNSFTLTTNPVQSLTQVLDMQLDTRGTTAVEDSTVPSQLTLKGNYPNPFNPSTLIRYDLPQSALVKLSVFDLRGALVSTLVETAQDAGSHQVVFNGAGLATGVYFYRLEVGDTQLHRKMLLIK